MGRARPIRQAESIGQEGWEQYEQAHRQARSVVKLGRARPIKEAQLSSQ